MVDSGSIEKTPEGAGKLPRIMAVLFVLGATIFWIFAFSPLARDIFTAPDQLSDETYISSIQARCVGAGGELDELPAARTATSPADRATSVIAATAILEEMVQDIAATDGGTADDQRLVARWVSDWEIYLGDRTRHVERLLTEGDVRFLNTEDNGIFIAERMDGFARVNEIDVCLTPGDI